MRLLFTISLFLSLNVFSQGYSSINEPYKGHVTLTKERGAKHITKFIDSIINKNPHHNSEVFGKLKIIFKIDSLYRIYDAEVLYSVDPYYDSIVINNLTKISRSNLDHLKIDKFYGVSFQFGKDKYINKFFNALILFADNKTVKSERKFYKLLTKAPQNSRVLFYLGKSMLENGKKKGLGYIEKAANNGDIDAREYLKKKKP